MVAKGNISRATAIAAYPAFGGNITYSFYQTLPSEYANSTVPYPDGNNQSPSFSSIFKPILPGDPERDIFATSTGLISSFANITFTETTSQAADLGIAVVDYTTPSGGAWASPGNQNATDVQPGNVVAQAGDIWLTAPALVAAQQNAPGSTHQDYAYWALPHELGHALGLHHTFYMNGQTELPFGNLLASENNLRFSIMAYQPHPTELQAIHEFQLYDIASLQKQYGAAESNAGSDFYSIFDEVNRADGTVQDRVFSIWDSSGKDTIDASNTNYQSIFFGSGSLIDLRPGYFSSIGIDSGVEIVDGNVNDAGDENISIAFGAYIENAKGGIRNDALIGNLLSNRLEGGAGDDLLYGEGVLRPDEENPVEESYDRIVQGGLEGPSADIAQFSNDPTQQMDKLFGGDGNDQLWGGRGNDELDGGEGSDLLYGWLGIDTVLYGSEAAGANITILAGAGTEARIQANRNAPDADVRIQALVITGGDVDTLIDIEAIKLTDQSDTVRLEGDINNHNGATPLVEMRGSAVAFHEDEVDASAATGGIYFNLGSGNAVGLDQTVDRGYLGWLTSLVGVKFEPTDLRITGANSAIGTEYSDALLASSGSQGSGEGYSALYGGGGNDFLVGGGWESHLYGGEGADYFEIRSNTYVEDSQAEDSTSYFGIPLYGGAKQWWMEGNTAYWAPFSTLLTAFPVIGSSILMTAAFFVDAVTMKFARYQRDAEGNLLIDLWGQSAPAVIRDYQVDPDSGVGTAGITVFEATRDGDGGATLDRIERFVNLALKAGFGVGLYGFDPLVLDLDGDGYELTSEGNSRTYFEFDTDGFGERTGWVRGDDGLLALDGNNNGSIDDVTELFGNRTTSGFVELATHDSNADGKIDASDSVYADLRIWRDTDQDGVTDSGELATLSELGIASIALSSTVPTEATAVGGNVIARTGTYTRTDGSTGGVADVAFNINETATRWLGDTSVSTTAALLPQLNGFGELKDLRVAMTEDALLQTKVTDFTSLTTNDLTTLKTEAEAILYAWAGVSSVPATAIGAGGFDVRKLAFLEKYSGHELMPRDSNGAPLSTNLAELEALWHDQLTRLTLRLVVQGPLASAFDGISYREEIDLLVADTPAALSDLYSGLLADLPSDPVDALAQWQEWAPLLGAMAEGMRRTDANLVRGDYVAAQLLSAMNGVVQPLDFATLATALGIENLRVGTSSGETLSRGSASGTAAYVGSGGNDTLDGGTGQDVYIFGQQIGQVVIDDEEADPAGDRLRFAFHSADDVSLARNGNDLLITVIATGETIRIVGQFAPVTPISSDVLLSSNKGIEEIQFADGGIFEIPEIMTAVGTGTMSADHLIGTMHSDVLIGGEGNDRLEGGDDADLYVVNAGDGQDVIRDAQTTPLLRAADLLIFGDNIAPDELVFSRAGANGNDLLISVGTAGQSVLIEGQFSYSVLGYNDNLAPNSRIEAFAFRDYGDGWSLKDLQQQLILNTTTSGSDTSLGFGDDDYFGASAGADLLIGLDGADHYRWGRGSGNDVIDERSLYIDVTVGLGGLSLTVDADTVLFSNDISVADVVFARTSADPDLTITLNSTGETLTIVNQFAGFQTGVLGAQWLDRIEWFEFADGTRLSWQAVLADVTTGTDADDALYGDLWQDRMDGRLGNDTLSGKGDADTYVFALGYGHDTLADANTTYLGVGFITPDTAPDILEFAEGITTSDVTFVRSGSDIDLVIGNSGDRVTLAGQDSYLQTGVFGALAQNRIEEIRFFDGTVWTWQELNRRVIDAFTSDGDDSIDGFTMEDRFEASPGNDTLAGGDSADTYVFGRGSGHDEIRETVSNVLYGDSDVVELGSDILPAEIELSRVDGDLILSIAGTTDQLMVKGQFGFTSWFSWTDVEEFRFANGAVWTKQDVQSRLLESTAGDDSLVGFFEADTLDGGSGNDTLEGADGADTYVFGRGYGHDIIRENVSNANLSDSDRIMFGVDILPSDVAFSRDSDDLIVTIVDTGDSLSIEGHFAFQNWFAWWDVERFEFANGTILTDLQISAQILGGTAGDDRLTGTFRSDTLDGGLGNDTLEGGDGADTYIFGQGYGQDLIIENVSNANLSDDDRLIFGPGITLQDLNFIRDGSTLTVEINGTNDSISIYAEFANQNWFTWWDIDRFVFDNGSFVSREDIQQIILTPSSGDDHLIGFHDANVMDGGSGNDILEGKDGEDTYLFGYGSGSDIIRERVDNANLSDADQLVFEAGISLSDVDFVRDDNDLIISTLSTGDSVRIEGQFYYSTTNSFTWHDIETFVFSDIILSKQDVQQLLISGTSEDDYIVGFGSPDTLAGGGGNDTLAGGGRNDRYIYEIGDGDDVIFDYLYYLGSDDTLQLGVGITSSDLIISLAPADLNDVLITFSNSAGSILLDNQWWGDAGIETIEFADGSSWTEAQIAAPYVAKQTSAGDDTVQGTYLADVLDGSGGNDTLIGGDANDTLKGGTGDDRLEGQEGADQYEYALGDGHDSIIDRYGSRSNRLTFAAGVNPADIILSRVSGDFNDIRITFIGASGSIVIDDQWWDDAGVEAVDFADGTSWSELQLAAYYVTQQTTLSADTIWGTPFADAAVGAGGDDLLQTSSGNDTLHGDTGNDRLEGGTGADDYIYELSGGDDVIYDYQGSRNNRLLLGAGITTSMVNVRVSSSDTRDIVITFTGQAGSITFDQQSWGDAGIEQIVFQDGAIWNEQEIANRAVTGAGTSGNDNIAGTSFNDYLAGGQGNDTISGYAGNDTLVGGEGNDSLLGAAGSDVYIYDVGGGNDVIYDHTSSRSNTLLFGVDIDPDNIVFSRSSSDFDHAIVTFIGLSGSILLQNQWWGDAGVETIEFFDGTIWTEAQIAEQYVSQQTTVGNDYITATHFADNVEGSAGDDTIIGGAGNDTIRGGSGNDRLEGNEDVDVYIYESGHGNDVIYDYRGSRSNKLVFGTGIDTTDIAFSRVANNFDSIMINVGSSGSIVFEKQWWGDAGVELFEFASGVIWNEAHIAAQYVSHQTTGGNDHITATHFADSVEGSAGDDTIIGGAGNDTIRGGSGNDRLEGNEDADVYIYESGHGNDVIYDYRGSRSNKLVFGTGIDTTDIAFSRVANNFDSIMINVGSSGSIVFEKQWWGDAGVELFEFASGVIWNEAHIAAQYVSHQTTGGNDHITATHFADSVEGGTGNDTLIGGSGNDTLSGGSGNDSLDGGSGLDWADFSFGSSSWTINLAAASNQATSGSETDTLTAIENVITGGGADTVTGSTAANLLTTGDGNDRITGGAGNDTIQGGSGADIAVFAGLQASYTLTTTAGTVTVVDTQTGVDGNDGTDALMGVETAEFKGGVQVSLGSPIIFDLDGDGVELVDRRRSKAKFDWDGDGKRDSTGWVGKDDGLLVFDRNGNGKIDALNELSFIDDRLGAKSDLDGLIAFDTNEDGIFSDLDDRFASFAVWRDRDGDGKTDRGEMTGLSNAGIASIDLAGQAVERSWGWQDNLVINTGTYVRTDGTERGFGDVALNYQGSVKSARTATSFSFAARMLEAIAAFNHEGADEATFTKQTMEVWRTPLLATSLRTFL